MRKTTPRFRHQLRVIAIDKEFAASMAVALYFAPSDAPYQSVAFDEDYQFGLLTVGYASFPSHRS